MTKYKGCISTDKTIVPDLEEPAAFAATGSECGDAGRRAQRAMACHCGGGVYR